MLRQRHRAEPDIDADHVHAGSPNISQLRKEVMIAGPERQAGVIVPHQRIADQFLGFHKIGHHHLRSIAGRRGNSDD